MAYLVVLVLDNPDQCPDVLDAWEAAGITGVTILESTGIGRMRRKGIVDNLPLMPSLGDLLKSRETHHRTLFSLVPTEKQVQVLIDTTQAIVGDLDQEHTGLLFVLDVMQVFGLEKQSPKAG